MYVKLKFLIKWPDHEASMQTLSNVFRQYFPKLAAIIDCSEIFIYRPKTYKAKAQVNANYKKHATVKFLIACTPFGSISIMSKVCCGCVSDIDIVKGSGLVNPNLHQHGDQILADVVSHCRMSLLLGVGSSLLYLLLPKEKNSQVQRWRKYLDK